MLASETFTLAFDLKKMKVGCALMQAGFGATIPMDLFDMTFDVHHWETGDPTGMRLFKTNREELPKIVKELDRVRAIERTWKE